MGWGGCLIDEEDSPPKLKVAEGPWGGGGLGGGHPNKGANNIGVQFSLVGPGGMDTVPGVQWHPSASETTTTRPLKKRGTWPV